MERVQVIGQDKAEAHLEESWMKTESLQRQKPQETQRWVPKRLVDSSSLDPETPPHAGVTTAQVTWVDLKMSP